MKRLLVGFILGVAVSAVAGTAYKGGITIKRDVIKTESGQKAIPEYAVDIRWGTCPVPGCSLTRWPIGVYPEKGMTTWGTTAALVSDLAIIYVCPRRHVSIEPNQTEWAR